MHGTCFSSCLTQFLAPQQGFPPQGPPPRGHAVHPEWNAKADAAALRKAMKGLGTDDVTLIGIVAGRDRAFLQLVREEFKQLEKKPRDLVSDVGSETSFSYKAAATGLLLTEAEYRATVIMQACKGAGTDDRALIDAVMTASQQQIRDAKAAFQVLFKKDMVKVICDDISGDYQKLIVKICEGNPFSIDS